MKPQRIAEFYKVTFDEFANAIVNVLPDIDLDCIYDMYDTLKAPKRATKQSACYDFFTPFNIKLNPGESVMIPTGFKCRIDDGWSLNLYSKSGLGTKFRLRLNTCASIVDADYFNNDNNEGHIFAKIMNEGDKIVTLTAGSGFMQGKFEMFGITESDDAEGVRVGGFGSTGA